MRVAKTTWANTIRNIGALRMVRQGSMTLVTQLILKRASASRPSGEWSEDDFASGERNRT
jgi:hypothetical protein